MHRRIAVEGGLHIAARACLVQVQAGFGRLLRMNMPEWHWAVLGSAASAGLGVLWPAFALAMSSILSVYYNPDHEKQKHTIQTWCIVFGAVGAGSMLCSTVQQFAFTLMGQKLTRRLRVLLMTALLKQVNAILLWLEAPCLCCSCLKQTYTGAFWQAAHKLLCLYWLTYLSKLRYLNQR